MNMPRPGSKPSPITPEESRELALKKARETEMPFHRYYALARNRGAYSVLVSTGQTTGITLIRLRGIVESRHVEATAECPKGHPLALYMAQALEQFTRGMTVKAEREIKSEPPERLPMTVEDVGEGKIKIGPKAGTELDSRTMTADERWEKSGLPASTFKGTPAEIAARFKDLDPKDASRAQLEQVAEVFKMALGVIEVTPAERATQSSNLPDKDTVSVFDPSMARERAQIAKEIASRSAALNVDKPHEAGEGKRLPLRLPLCKQCKTQPVYHSAAEFCGGQCAKAWHMAQIAASKGVKL